MTLNTPASVPHLTIKLPSLADASVLVLGGADASQVLLGYGNVVGGADGQVTLTGCASLSAISLGDGADRVSLDGALNTIVLGNGDVVVHANGGGACVRIAPGDLQVDYGNAVHVTLAMAMPGFGASSGARSGFVDSGRSFGWFEGGQGNVGILNGLGSAAGNGAGNVGALNGNFDGLGDQGQGSGAGNGCGNVGVLNGNLDGGGNQGQGSGTGNGRLNVGALNGNGDGNGNFGPRNGHDNGVGNLGTANGNFDGNLNQGEDNGNGNGQGNVGNLNGNLNGNGAALAPQTTTASSAGFTLTGALDTVVVGNGNDTVWVAGGLSTIVAGNGRDSIHIGGSYDTVVAGNGGDEVTGCVDHAAVRLGCGDDHVTLSGAGGNVVQTGAGDDVIRVSGWDNLVDAGASQHHDIIYGGCGRDTFVATAAGHGLDQIYNFSASAGDVLDMRGALAAAGWHLGACGIAAELHASSSGGNTWIGIGAGAGVMVAELMGVAASSQTLLANHALRVA